MICQQGERSLQKAERRNETGEKRIKEQRKRADKHNRKQGTVNGDRKEQKRDKLFYGGDTNGQEEIIDSQISFPFSRSPMGTS